MIRICEIVIERFRSIIKMNYKICLDSNIIALCGQNNVGKTNTLRALNIFFNPEQYDREIDMPRIKYATGGAAIHPKLIVTFYDDKNSKYYCITRNIAQYSDMDSGLEGFEYTQENKRKENKRKLLNEEMLRFLDKIEYAYIESINILMPELVEKLTTEVIDVQYDKTRFSETKRKLKDSYDAYIDGLNDIMGAFAEDISETFKNFRDDWSVKFDVPKNSDTFRQLISDDIKLQLDDCGSVGVEDKGAGLQRLATILLQFEMLSRLHNRKQIIVCIDEPDVYLHEGLQKKLKKFFDEKSQDMQLFLTTHSKIFINPYSMKNVFLLSAKTYTQYSVRKKKKVNVVETFLENIKDDDGYKNICNHLGIETIVHEPLEKNNILVEGKCDKKYIEELCKYFSIDFPSIISLEGADNAIKYLEFYNSYYFSLEGDVLPNIKVVLDNDAKGREVYSRIERKKKNYHAINVSCQLIQNFMGDANVSGNLTNNEIEDFVYPELVCFLINLVLPKMKLKRINEKKICKNIVKKSFGSKGILSLCEHEKNEKNPEDGGKISFTFSGENTNKFKDSLATSFNIQANITILELIEMCSEKYPKVEMYLRDLCDFSVDKSL